MICIETVKRYCTDYTKIENYKLAVEDKTQVWHCHHKLGIMPFSKKTISSKKLKKYGLYYNQPPEVLIFLKASEHHSLHLNCMSDEWHEKLSDAIKSQETNDGRFKKGQSPWHKGKVGVYSEETKRKMSEAKKGKPSSRKGKKCFNNGIKNVYSKECPDGFKPGMLRKGSN